MQSAGIVYLCPYGCIVVVIEEERGLEAFRLAFLLSYIHKPERQLPLNQIVPVTHSVIYTHCDIVLKLS